MIHGTLLIAHPSAELYGSDRVMLEAIDAATGRGQQVHVTLPGPGPLVAEITGRGAEVSFCPAPVLRKSALRPRGLVALVAGVVRGTVGGVKLIRATKPAALYVSTLTIPLWQVLGRILRVPVVLHVHESERQAPALVRRVLATPVLLAHLVLVNSEFSRSVLADSYSRLGRRSQVLYNGVPGPARAEPARSAIDGAARLVFVGRLAPRKGPQVAVEVIRVLRERGVTATLDIVGSVFPGYEWFEDQVRAQISAGGLTDAVRLLGFRPDVWPHLAAADVVLVPSQGDEPFGNIAVEAILAGRPVVVSSGSGLDEAVRGFSCARSVRPDDPGAFADAVQGLINAWPQVREDIATDMADAARRFAPGRFRDQFLAQLDQLGRSAAPAGPVNR